VVTFSAELLSSTLKVSSYEPRTFQPMRRYTALLVLAIGCTISTLGVGAQAQQQTEQGQAESKRKLISRADPEYPEVAKTMRIEGSVKMEVVIAPNGSAKSVEVKGGHPMLVQAAVDAVHKWKWAPGPHESKEIVEIKFTE